MSTTILTEPQDGHISPANKPSGRRRCCPSRRVGALLVGSASLAFLLASISATVFGIVSAPDTKPAAPAQTLSPIPGLGLRPFGGAKKKKSSSAGKNVGGILVEGGLRDPASGGGGSIVEEIQEETEEGDGPALIVVTRGGGGKGGRLVGSAGGGHLFFNPASDRQVVIIRPGADGEQSSVIVASPEDLLPAEADVAPADAAPADVAAAPGDADSSNATSDDAEGIIASLTNGLMSFIDEMDSEDSANSTNSTNVTNATNVNVTTTTTTTTEEPSMFEPPPLTTHLWLRPERGPLAVALALQIVFFVLTSLMLHGVRKRREDLVLLWLVAAAFGLAVGSAGAVLSALSAFDVGTLGAILVGLGYIGGQAVLWCGWAVVVAYHRQATPPEFDRSRPHFG